MSNTDRPTIVTELTPRGRGAVAVVLVAGPDALEAVRSSFVPSTAWAAEGPPVGRIGFGRWGHDHGEEIVVCRVANEEFEVHCHGGTAATGAILRRLESLGCRGEAWQAWLESGDAIASSALIELANTPTARAAAVLLDQTRGALRGRVSAALDSVRDGKLGDAGTILDDILQYAELGLRLTSPWRVVLMGRPNVGKSSLINRIAGFERAIVSATPGTTRDVVSLTTAVDGWPVQFSDTAGMRETGDSIEAAGVALGRAAAEDSDLILLVSDVDSGESGFAELSHWLPDTAQVLRVMNKIDLAEKAGNVAARPFAFDSRSDGIHYVSALSGQGVLELIEAISRVLVPAVPPMGAAVAFTEWQLERLKEARRAVSADDIGAADIALSTLLQKNAV